MSKMKLYSDNTPNGWKVDIMLAELGMEINKDYEFIHIDISNGDQFQPEFLKISSNNKIPAIVVYDDGRGKISLFESGAILIYLADEYNSPLLPQGLQNKHLRYSTLTWLMFQIGGLGPMLGQSNHFNNAASERAAYAIERYNKEADRLYGVMDKRLGDAPYLAGDVYSIADIASFPWILSHNSWYGKLSQYPNLADWYGRIIARSAVDKLIQRLTS